MAIYKRMHSVSASTLTLTFAVWEVPEHPDLWLPLGKTERKRMRVRWAYFGEQWYSIRVEIFDPANERLPEPWFGFNKIWMDE